MDYMTNYLHEMDKSPEKPALLKLTHEEMENLNQISFSTFSTSSFFFPWRAGVPLSNCPSSLGSQLLPHWQHIKVYYFA